jgi:hypothetical protein
MSGAEAVAVLAELTLRDRSLALGASDQRTSETTMGLEQLGCLVRRYPATV